jgi:hypothetical protein
VIFARGREEGQRTLSEMSKSRQYPPLRPLHPETSLSAPKLAKMESLTTDVLTQSLLPGQKDCLKIRPDGTILDGHHRIYVLRRRGVDVEALPREIVVKGND